MDRTIEEAWVERVRSALVRTLPSAAVAALAVAGLGLWLLTHAGQAARPDEWLRAVPPSVVLYSPGVLTMRGGAAEPFAEAFDDAIAPWQAGNYAEAALRLDALASTYPAVAEAHFYRGAAWLLAGVPDDAVGPLRRAVALAPAALQADASWYLGLALLQTRRTDAALAAFSAGCTAGDARACRAAEHLGTTRHAP